MNAAGLPESIGEYLGVWCGDLLEPLDGQARFDVVNGLCERYRGGPYPGRAMIQRLVERRLGIITKDQQVGAIIDSHGGVDAVIGRLADPASHAAAVTQLASLDGTRTYVQKVRQARREGLLAQAEETLILSTTLRRGPLPELIPAPPHLPAIPLGYPDSPAGGGR